MNRITHLRFRQVRRPMRTLFSTALGQKSVATSVLVEVALDGGWHGHLARGSHGRLGPGRDLLHGQNASSSYTSLLYLLQ